MEDLRRPCAHRGTADVLKSVVETTQGPVDLCICKQCRRFWLERQGWLLSRRETMSIVRDWPHEAVTLAR
jgi:hypothetical protein